MRIVSISVEGVRKLRAAQVDFDPTGNLVELHGPNETGKSSLMDAIAALFEPYAINSPDRPFDTFVNDQSDRAIVSGVLSENGKPRFDVRRIVNKEGKTTTLTVRDRETGAQVVPPQKFLSSLFSSVARDPLLFLDKPAAEQFKYFAKIKGIDGALAASDLKVKQAEDARKSARSALDLAEKLETRDRAAYDAAVAANPNATGEPVDVQSVMKEKATLESGRRTVESTMREVANVRAESERLNRLIIETMAKVDELEAQATALDDQLKSAKPLDQFDREITGCTDRIVNAQRLNDLAAKWKAAQTAKAEHDAKARAFAESEAAVKSERSERQRIVADAPSPVPGLDIDAETKTILLDGRPIADESTARRTEISIDLAVAENPKLKVLFLKQGAFLDGAHLARISKRLAAADPEFMLIFETVQREVKPGDDPTTFVIYGADFKRDAECEDEIA